MTARNIGLQRGWSKAVCGTIAGFQRHMREGTDVCQDCRTARRNYNRIAQREWRTRQREAAS